MVDATWEKNNSSEKPKRAPNQGGNLKFLIGGFVMLAAVAYLIFSGTATGARYFITIDELVNNPEYVGETVRVSGAVMDTTDNPIVYIHEGETLTLDFVVVHIPTETDNLAKTLYDAVNDETAARMPVHIADEVKPDLLQHEAQAIMTGTLGEDGIFYATELLLKCPSRYEEAIPEQIELNTEG